MAATQSEIRRVIVSTNRFLDIEPYCRSLWNGAQKHLWMGIMPWEFPQTPTIEEEQAFLHDFFGQDEIDVQGGGADNGSGYRFLKQVWYCCALWNWNNRVPAIAAAWLASGDKQAIVNNPSFTKWIFSADVKPSTFFQPEDVAMYGTRCLAATVGYLQHLIYKRLAEKEGFDLPAICNTAPEQKQITQEAATSAKHQEPPMRTSPSIDERELSQVAAVSPTNADNSPSSPGTPVDKNPKSSIRSSPDIHSVFRDHQTSDVQASTPESIIHAGKDFTADLSLTQSVGGSSEASILENRQSDDKEKLSGGAMSTSCSNLETTELTPPRVIDNHNQAKHGLNASASEFNISRSTITPVPAEIGEGTRHRYASAGQADAHQKGKETVATKQIPLHKPSDSDKIMSQELGTQDKIKSRMAHVGVENADDRGVSQHDFARDVSQYQDTFHAPRSFSHRGNLHVFRGNKSEGMARDWRSREGSSRPITSIGRIRDHNAQEGHGQNVNFDFSNGFADNHPSQRPISRPDNDRAKSEARHRNKTYQYSSEQFDKFATAAQHRRDRADFEMQRFRRFSNTDVASVGHQQMKSHFVDKYVIGPACTHITKLVLPRLPFSLSFEVIFHHFAQFCRIEAVHDLPTGTTHNRCVQLIFADSQSAMIALSRQGQTCPWGHIYIEVAKEYWTEAPGYQRTTHERHTFAGNSSQGDFPGMYNGTYPTDHSAYGDGQQSLEEKLVFANVTDQTRSIPINAVNKKTKKNNSKGKKRILAAAAYPFSDNQSTSRSTTQARVGPEQHEVYTVSESAPRGRITPSQIPINPLSMHPPDRIYDRDVAPKEIDGSACVLHDQKDDSKGPGSRVPLKSADQETMPPPPPSSSSSTSITESDSPPCTDQVSTINSANEDAILASAYESKKESTSDQVIATEIASDDDPLIAQSFVQTKSIENEDVHRASVPTPSEQEQVETGETDHQSPAPVISNLHKVFSESRHVIEVSVSPPDDLEALPAKVSHPPYLDEAPGTSRKESSDYGGVIESAPGPKAAISRAATKKKGPAQTESFSMFGKKAKQASLKKQKLKRTKTSGSVQQLFKSAEESRRDNPTTPKQQSGKDLAEPSLLNNEPGQLVNNGRTLDHTGVGTIYQTSTTCISLQETKCPHCAQDDLLTSGRNTGTTNYEQNCISRAERDSVEENSKCSGPSDIETLPVKLPAIIGSRCIQDDVNEEMAQTNGLEVLGPGTIDLVRDFTDEDTTDSTLSGDTIYTPSESEVTGLIEKIRAKQHSHLVVDAPNRRKQIKQRTKRKVRADQDKVATAQKDNGVLKIYHLPSPGESGATIAAHILTQLGEDIGEDIAVKQDCSAPDSRTCG